MIKFRIIDNHPQVKIGIVGNLLGLILYGAIKILKQFRFLVLLLTIVNTAAISYGIYLYLFNHKLIELTIFALITICFVIPGILSGSHFNVILESPQTIKTINEKFETGIQELKSKGKNDPLSVLEIDTNRLAEYYDINQKQAKASFNWAIFAMVLGLLTIMAGIWLYYYEDGKGSGTVLITSLTTCAGIITNFISGLFIYLHNETQKRSLIYYSNLIKNQQMELSIVVANEVNGEAEKNEIKKEIIKELCRRGIA